MNNDLLKKKIQEYIGVSKKEATEHDLAITERLEYVNQYNAFTKDRILSMDEDAIYEYLSPLWAMLIWGNKHYVIDKIIDDNGISNFRKKLADLIWGSNDIADRWDKFRKGIKGMGPAMISEILCKSHPNDFILWNRRAYVGLNYLGVERLPRYDYQLTGKVYKYLCEVGKHIADKMDKAGAKDTTLLAVDYFIWDKLQVADNLSKIHAKSVDDKKQQHETREESTFIHNDIRDKVRDIGQWLGFEAAIERKVSDGSKVDAIWESTIGNMGRVIYVFEVQTKGSIDSLILNLLKSLNNQAVQGVVAISDTKQIERIKKHAHDVKDLRDKLKYWEYTEVLNVHESLSYVNESINKLKLVPEGF